MSKPRRVVLVVFDGFQLLDLAGPADVFTAASLLVPSSPDGYQVEVTAMQAGPVRASSGITVQVPAGSALSDIDGDIDTLLVAGGLTTTAAEGEAVLIEAITRLAATARRTGSICSGAFLLAAAGLLAGRRATTHWARAAELARRYPHIHLDPDRIHVHDQGIWTSAGVTAGIDLALALVADDHGPDLAREIARWLVVYLQRPGGQSQFSVAHTLPTPRREPLRELQAFIEDHVTADLSLQALATQANMSVRNFQRAFAADVGLPPGQYVERVRLSVARRLLETTDRGLGHIADACGLGAPETLHRVFQRHLGVTPGDYRRRFRSALPRKETT